jgi:hypothetical protein
MTDKLIDPSAASAAILNTCNEYMVKNKSIIAQQEIIWGLVDNLSVVIAVSQPPLWVMKDILSAISNAHERDVSGYNVVDPRGLQ